MSILARTFSHADVARWMPRKTAGLLTISSHAEITMQPLVL